MGKKREKRVLAEEPPSGSDASGTASRKRLAVAMTALGAAMTLAGLLAGRGAEQGMLLIQARLFLLVVGFCVALAGLVGLAAAARGRRAGKGR